ncbi:MAG: ABC transporter permease [Polyangiaceae bacterium]|nr:ABC transporter permease [Polyangiaceae bacterium]
MLGKSQAPSRKDAEAKGWLEALGAQALGAYQLVVGLLSILSAALRSSIAPGKGAAEVCRALTIRQIFYTSFQTLSMVSVVALLIGATLVAQTELLGGTIHRDIAARIVVAIILREVAPLVTAIIVTGRSGTAIATELGVMKVNQEVIGLASLGIDPPRFLVWPRILATTLSVPLLTVFFSAAAVLGGLAVAFLMDSEGVGEWQVGVSMGLTPWDLPLLLVKSIGLGAIIGWVCSYYGLEVGVPPTEVPQKASKAIVRTLVALIAFNATMTVAFYWIVGTRLS